MMALLRSASMNFTREFVCGGPRSLARGDAVIFSWTGQRLVMAWTLLDHDLTIDGWARLRQRC